MALTPSKRKWGVWVPGKQLPYLIGAHSPQEAREHIARVVGVPTNGMRVRPIPAPAPSKRVEIISALAPFQSEERRHYAPLNGDRAFRLLK